MNQQREEIEIDLRDIFYVLKKRFLIILLTAMAVSYTHLALRKQL